MPHPRRTLDPVNCANCGTSFQRRRPSSSGSYYCSKRECQNTRQRLYMQDRRADVIIKADEIAQANAARLVYAALRGERIQCPECGLVNAINGFKHPSRDRTGCAALGVGMDGVTVPLIFAIWPDGTREYADVNGEAL